ARREELSHRVDATRTAVNPGWERCRRRFAERWARKPEYESRNPSCTREEQPEQAVINLPHGRIRPPRIVRGKIVLLALCEGVYPHDLLHHRVIVGFPPVTANLGSDHTSRQVTACRCEVNPAGLDRPIARADDSDQRCQ